MSFAYEYPRAALAVDCVVFGLDEVDLKVLLIQRRLQPFQHAWALPGGFVHVDETLDEAARRELAEEAGVTDIYLEQLYTFGTLDRDPRERVVTVAYFALAKLSDHRIRAATDAMGVGWFSLDELPKLAFDHSEVVTTARDRLRGKVRYAPVGFELLPPRFSLTQLQRLYEIILGTDLDKRNFRKKILAMDLIVETDEVEQNVRHRAARLYRFDRRKYDRLAKHGFSFAI
ncbi:MAG TPA: NUDIX domain-containing protein [Kofleriaceae bacterium]|nr:NUDIX domain-containing protein [Kofleriaceae bacterium]